MSANYVSAMEFDTDIVDTDDASNIDFSRFNKAGYVMPGKYLLTITLNGRVINERLVDVYLQNKEHMDSSEACLTQSDIALLGLHSTQQKKLISWHHQQCISLSALPESRQHIDLGKSELAISVPQAFLTYSDPDWDPPTRWDNGVAGGFLDYNLSVNVNSPAQRSTETSTSVFGTAGANAGAWRFRGDYQGRQLHSSQEGTQSDFSWTRIYAFRPLSKLLAKMTAGESYLDSEVFDGWRYAGMSISSDESMLSPNQRGYAPEVGGIARTNANVVISQQGQVIYQTTVPAGPFRIRNLNSVIAGRLDVRVEEQNGEVQRFHVDASTVPYMTRPGMLRYKSTVGRPTRFDHRFTGPLFTAAEFSWGMSSNWTLYGGTTLSESYQAYALGVGRDLFGFGALSTDVTQMQAKSVDGVRNSGKSLHFNYSKYFDSFNGGITFAGYRFSEQSFLTMAQFLSLRDRSINLSGRNKSMYNLVLNKNFIDPSLSLYFNYSHQDFWDRPTAQNYSFTLSRLFDLPGIRNLSLSLSLNHTQTENHHDNMLFGSLTLPLGRGTVSYEVQRNGHQLTQSASYYQRLNDHNSMRLTAGGGNSERAPAYIDTYFNHSNDWADMSLTAAYAKDRYRSAGFTLQGGGSATAYGAALHPGYGSGSTRLMVDTGSAGHVSINNGVIHTNRWGIGVLTNQSSYYRTRANIDIDRLPAGIEAIRPVTEATLTEGAIGYRRFNILQGWKGMVTVRQGKGFPPFGASVMDASGRELGIVGDGGQAYVAGIQAGDSLVVVWKGKSRCRLAIPSQLKMTTEALLLHCRP